jgi:hypothetical protein
MKLKRFYYSCILLICSCSYQSSDYTDDLGEGYTFVSESNANQFIYAISDTSGVNAIPCTVEAFGFDEDFIIAKQRNNRDCLDEDLTNVPMAYWIIDKKKKMNYGPYDSLTYSVKRRELNVPKSLSLQN